MTATKTTDKPKDEKSKRFNELVMTRPALTATYTSPRAPNAAARLEGPQTKRMIADNLHTAGPTPETKHALDVAEAEYAEALAKVPTMTFHLRAIGQTAYSALIRKYPATPAQIEEARALLGPQFQHLPYDPEKLAPHLLSLAIKRITFSDSEEVIEGRIRTDEIAGMIESESWSSNDAAALLDVAQELNQKPTNLSTR